MKKGVHPDYHTVLFVDSSTGDEWVSFSTMKGTGDSREVAGDTLPVIRLDVSAFSHPFWTGHARELDTEGRIDRFRRRYAGKSKKA
ncbi:MAG: type B 50S ribosomal protein L31 [Deltaproteobacteria bacterium]|nr:type B 50S ribosomal protein L31 [Deltaproteobacteria bacterium]